MSRRNSIILATLVVILLVGIELGVRQWSSSRACVQIVNQGDGTMEDLVASYRGTTFAVGRLTVGASAKVWFTIGPRGPLKLEYRQKGHSLGSFQIPDFDPIQNLNDDFKLVLVIRSNTVERFMEDADSRQGREKLWDRIRQWMGIDPPEVKR
jgi:hypothetical protein